MGVCPLSAESGGPLFDASVVVHRCDWLRGIAGRILATMTHILRLRYSHRKLIRLKIELTLRKSGVAHLTGDACLYRLAIIQLKTRPPLT